MFSQDMRDNETIDKLNSVVKIRLAPSTTHGVGVFAIREIPMGTKLYANVFPQAYKLPYGSLKKLWPEVRELILDRWPRVVNSEAFMWPDTFLQGYINHSDDPNYDCVNDVALRDIKVGEEITEDYRKIEGWMTAYPWLKIKK